MKKKITNPFKNLKFKKLNRTSKTDKPVKTAKAHKTKPVKKERTSGRKGISIRIQLLAGFIIPILFVVLVGTISYQKASEGLTRNYEESSDSALSMTISSFDESMKSVTSILMELSQDTNVRSYSLGGYSDNTSKADAAKQSIRNNLNVKATSNSLIENIHIIPITGEEVLTTKKLDSASIDSFISSMESSDDGALLKDGLIHWQTAHPFIDDKLGIGEGEYAVFASQMFNSGSVKGIVVIDISTKGLIDMLNKLDFGEGSYACFYNQDGMDICNKEDFSVTSLDEELLNTDDSYESKYIDYNGSDYYFMQMKSTTNDAVLAVLVPKSHITESSDYIKRITIILVAIACLAAFGICTLIITMIGRNINSSIKQLEKVANGELIEIKDGNIRDRNEFGKLRHAIASTVSKMRQLLLTVSDTKNQVLTSFDNVRSSTEELGSSVESVNGQIEEINSNIEMENSDITGCNEQMESLSVRIKTVNKRIKDIMEQVTQSRQLINNGMQAVEDMMVQSRDTANATKEVQQQVSSLESRLGQISSFVDVIQSIAQETNLLSLNASIEAARAGESGRGFAVVAQEIRKLADSSAETVNEIHTIIKEIDEYSQAVMGKVESAEQISSSQVESAHTTIAAFTQINAFMETLTEHMDNVNNDVVNMNTERHNTLRTIQSIQEASSHSVESTKEVSRILEEQMEASELLQKETDKMNERILELQEAIGTFVL